LFITAPPNVELIIGTSHVTVGSMTRDQLVKNVIQTIKEACPWSQDQGCHPNVKGEFIVDVRKSENWKDHVRKDNLVVTVESAQWHGNTEIYGILVKATAAVVERGTRLSHNCYWFLGKEITNKKVLPQQNYTFCSTTNHVAISLPRDNYINVSLSSPQDNRGKFDCVHVRDTMGDYFEDIEPQINQAFGLDIRAVYKDCGV
jgi:hypothetical protein